MNDTNGYAVFFFPQALEVLGDPVRPFLQDGPAGPHVASLAATTASNCSPAGRVTARPWSSSAGPTMASAASAWSAPLAARRVT